MQQLIASAVLRYVNVNHGGGRGKRVPQNLEWETLMQIVSPDFVIFQYFKHQIASITMQ